MKARWARKVPMGHRRMGTRTRCKRPRPGGCVVRRASRMRMLLVPGGYRARNPGRRWIAVVDRILPGVVVGDLSLVLGSLVLVGGSRGCIGLLVVGR